MRYVMLYYAPLKSHEKLRLLLRRLVRTVAKLGRKGKDMRQSQTS